MKLLCLLASWIGASDTAGLGPTLVTVQAANPLLSLETESPPQSKRALLAPPPPTLCCGSPFERTLGLSTFGNELPTEGLHI